MFQNDKDIEKSVGTMSAMSVSHADGGIDTQNCLEI